MGIAAEKAESIKTHRPVTVTFAERAVLLRMKKLVIPKALPKEAPFGPPTRPRPSTVAAKAARTAYEQAKMGNLEAAKHGNNLAFGLIADIAELEIMDRTASDMNAKKGTRECMPQTVWATLSSKPPPTSLPAQCGFDKVYLKMQGAQGMGPRT